jgi:thiopeptide-type bacteriocin biosynthesis protein
VDDNPWQQITIAYPGRTPQEREHLAVTHLARVLPAAETAGLITCWWFIRKGAWRVRYLPTQAPGSQAAAHAMITDGVQWTRDVYEPETHAFGGPQSMTAAHTLFHHDSRDLLTYLHHEPADRRERSLVLCTALMRAAGLDLNEQGDVWARVAEYRTTHLHPQPAPDTRTWQAFTADVYRLLIGAARTTGEWHTAFANAGATLRHLRENGTLTRGLRAVIALHVIFHWNRIGLPATTQATLAHAAQDAIFGTTATAPDPASTTTAC